MWPVSGKFPAVCTTQLFLVTKAGCSLTPLTKVLAQSRMAERESFLTVTNGRRPQTAFANGTGKYPFPLVPSLLIGKGRKLPTETKRQHAKAEAEDKTEQRIEVGIDSE